MGQVIFEVISNLSIKNIVYLCKGSIEPGKTVYHWKAHDDKNKKKRLRPFLTS